jgi:hypothetical protein
MANTQRDENLKYRLDFQKLPRQMNVLDGIILGELKTWFPCTLCSEFQPSQANMRARLGAEEAGVSDVIERETYKHLTEEYVLERDQELFDGLHDECAIHTWFPCEIWPGDATIVSTPYRWDELFLEYWTE